MKILNIQKVLLPLLLTALMAGVGDQAARAQTVLWGAAPAGGANNIGTIFSLNADGSGFQDRYDFLNDGMDGSYPYGSLIQAGSLLYGTTNGGGINSSGTIFSVDPASGSYQKVYDFGYQAGEGPFGPLVYTNGLLYGVTTNGGANNMGVIFSYDPVAGNYTDLLDLTITTGGSPYGGVLLQSNQLIFTTTVGGANGAGTILDYHLDAQTAADLYDFPVNSYANANFIFCNNLLYSVMNYGGQFGNGELFSFDPGTRQLTDLYDFSDPTQGYNPASIMLYQNIIYGVTFNGGSGPSQSGGVLFSYDPVAAAYTDLFNFDESLNNGYTPQAAPIELNGQLVGTTTAGGANGDGTVYALNTSTTALTKLGDFNGNDGNELYAPLVAVGPATPGTISQSISFPNMTHTYGDPDFVLPATTTSGLPITYSSSDYTIALLTGNNLHIAGAGTCTITASQPGNDVYATATPVTVTLTVNPAPLTIVADSQTANQNQPLPVFTAHYIGFVNGDTTVNLTAPPVITTTAASTAVQGVYPITATGAGSNNYTFSYVAAALTVIGQLQVFTVVDSTVNYGNPDFALATSGSGLPVTYAVDSADIAVVSPTDSTLLQIAGIGTTRVIARQGGNADWSPGTDTITLRVNPAPLTITANDATIVYGQPDPVFTVTYQGFVYGQDSSALLTQPIVSSTASDEIAHPGTYLTQAIGAAAQNYVITYVTGLFVVTLPGDSLNAWNSSSGMMTVSILSTAAGPVSLNLYSASGQRMFSTQLSLQNGFNEFNFPVSNLAAGIYIVRVEGSGIHLNQKLRLP